MFNNMLMGAAGESIKSTGGFSVDNSMLLNDDDSQYLIKENASNSGSGRTKFTISLWWKHGNIPSGGQNLFIQRNSSSNYMKCAIAGSGGNEAALQFFGATLGAFGTGDSTALLRDFHAWYHILFYYDSNDSTAGDRARIYLNGVRLTDFQTSATNPSLGAITQFGSNNAIVIGQNQGASGYSDGYMAQMAVVDGNALLPSSFTESDSNGVLRPIEIKAENLLNYSTTDETTGASATASGGASDAGKAIDDNDSTQWSEGSAATSAGATWTVTFSSAKHIRKITQYVASGNNVATGQKLQYYNGSTFVDAGAFTMVASSTKQTFYFDESAASTQWRLISTTAVGNPYSWCLNEVEMFEASNGFGDQGFYLPFTNSVELGLGGAPSSSTAATVTFVAATTNSATASSYTFSSQSLSTAATGRIIAVVVAAERTSSGARTVSSLTVAGTSAALVVRQTSDNGDAFEIWEAAVASGTSGDIVLNFNASMDSCGIGVYAVYNARYQEHFTIKAEGTSLSDTLVIPDNSIAIGGGHSTASSATGTFVGLTENYDEVIDAHISHAGASTSTASSAGGGTTISYTSSSPNADDTLIAATWFPSDGPTNLSSVNSPTQSTDTCTNNHAVITPLDTSAVLSKGNLVANTTTGAGQSGKGSIPCVVGDGNEYVFEAKLLAKSGSALPFIGVADAGSPTLAASQASADYRSYASGSHWISNGQLDGLNASHAYDNQEKASSFSSTFTTDDVIGVVVKNSGAVHFYKNGSQVFISSDQTGISVLPAGNWFPSFGQATGGSQTSQWEFRFGDDMSHTYGSAVKLTTSTLNTAQSPSIEDGSAHFQATTYSGNSSSNHVNQAGNSTFQPDFLWNAGRSVGSSKGMVDAVRGVSKYIKSSASSAEETESNASFMQFDADGFTMDGTSSTVHQNTSGRTYVAWQWLGGAGTASNSNGSITSTVSANPTAGFSIVSYTGTGSNATVGHGLSAEPDMIHIKRREQNESWISYLSTLGGGKHVYLNLTNSQVTASNVFNNTAATASVFSLGTAGSTNTDGETFIAYCFASIPNYCKFGSYEGNVNNDGPFIELGFKPTFLMVKNIDATGAWLMFDSAREPFNVMDLQLHADDSAAEANDTSRDLDFLANGIKLRGNSSYLNSAHTFIYMAWAEHPFAGSTPATAR